MCQVSFTTASDRLCSTSNWAAVEMPDSLCEQCKGVLFSPTTTPVFLALLFDW